MPDTDAPLDLTPIAARDADCRAHDWRCRDVDHADRRALLEEVGRLRAELADLSEHVDFRLRMAQEREAPYVSQWRRETGKPNTLPDYGDLLRWVIGKNEAFHHLAAAARRHARALREWDADTNVLPLPSECASGACGFPPDSSGSPCGSAQHIGNEWDHAEAHFLATVDTLGEPVP